MGTGQNLDGGKAGFDFGNDLGGSGFVVDRNQQGGGFANASRFQNIQTAGIDGGTDYSSEFTSLRPLENGRASFDDQFACIETIVRKYALDLKPLAQT